MVSVHPPLGEVERWLGEEGGEGGCPWIMTHCIALLKTLGKLTRCLLIRLQNMYATIRVFPGPLSLLTEALQVLTALLKFYFSSISYVNCFHKQISFTRNLYVLCVKRIIN